MINILIKKFIPNSDDISSPEVRKRYGILGGVLGIICNLLLFLIKIIVGTIINSIAVISDAFNNLSDMGSSLVSIIGAKLGGKRADLEHPYGHGRAEYISTLIISFLIIFFGIELLRNSAGKILNAEEVSTNIISIAILGVSVFVKLWMWYYNKYMGETIGSAILLAASRDSLNDVIATGAVIISAFIAPYVAFPIDGIAGICISVLIVKTGFDIAKETADRLLGAAPDEELAAKIEEYLIAEDMIMGMHGLMIHDYGPGCKIASVHAEVPANLSLVEVHNVIDGIEHRILSELNVDIVIHTDPVLPSGNSNI